MTRRRWPLVCALMACAAISTGCQLRRPDIEPLRMIEPQLVEPRPALPLASDATRVRLLDTQARGHIGRRLLHRLANNELVEDPVWRWSSPPDRYLDSALRLVIAASSDIRLVDAAGVPALSTTLIEWNLDTTANGQLVGAVELVVIESDRTVLTEVLRAREAVSPDLPGDLPAAAGRLLNALAVQSVSRSTGIVRLTPRDSDRP